MDAPFPLSKTGIACLKNCRKTAKKYDAVIQDMKKEVISAVPASFQKDVFSIMMARGDDQIQMVADMLKKPATHAMVVDVLKVLAKHSSKKKDNIEEMMSCLIDSCDKKTITMIYNMFTIVHELFQIFSSKEFKKAANVYVTAAKKQQEYVLKRIGPNI